MADKKRLQYQGRAFSDKDLEDLPIKDVVYPYEEVNLSQNALSAEGLRKVIQLCSRCENLRILKLYKNDIGDEGAKALAAYIRKSETLEEIHLSHNRFTARGVEMLVAACEKARAKANAPMWLRLEQNEVASPDEVVHELRRHYSVCDRKDQNRCTNRYCKRDCKVHLPHFHFQRQENGEPDNRGPKRRWGGEAWEDAPQAEMEDEHAGKWRSGAWWNEEKQPEAWQGNDWEAEGPRKRWRGDEPEAHPAEDGDQDDERPAGPRVKVSSGIFQRAMAAATGSKKAASTEAGPDAGTGGGSVPSTPARPQKAVSQNVASRTLSQLGVIAGEQRRNKVRLTSAPHNDDASIKKEDDEEVEGSKRGSEEAMEDGPQASDDEAKVRKEKEHSRAKAVRDAPPQDERRADNRYGHRDSLAEQADRTDRIRGRMRSSPEKRIDRPYRSPIERRRGGRDAGRDGGRGGVGRESSQRHRRYDGDRRAEDARRRHSPADKPRRRHEEPRGRTRSRSRRRQQRTSPATRQREARELPENLRRRGGSPRRKEQASTATRPPSPEKETVRVHGERRRRRHSAADEPMVDTARVAEHSHQVAEKSGRTSRTGESRTNRDTAGDPAATAPGRPRREEKEEPKLLTKQEQFESREKAPLVATRPKAAPRRPASNAAAATSNATPRTNRAPNPPAAVAPVKKPQTSSSAATPAAPKAPATIPKAVVEAGDGNESEYTYTDASEYTYEEEIVEEEEEEEDAEEADDDQD